ncbi:MAG TPA: autoinducer binding domain-containing protein [Xanthobacteraceae bacterium]|nr:autoinducer binding domain-containing protein [Xanthobacteraceae bacterium]
MGEAVFDPGRAAFDFIDEIAGMTDQRTVIDRLGREFAKFGFSAWVITGLPAPGGRMEELVLLNGWNPDWSSYYFKHNLIKDDPVGAHCFQSIGPFEWKDAPYDPQLWPEAKQIMDAAADVGMRYGFCVPIHTPAGFQAVVSVAGEHVDLSPYAKRALHLISLYAHDKAVSVVRPREPRQRLLTKREREILSWTAAGKTAWEISRILGISEATVVDHLKAAATKFATPNKVATVVAALRRGEIALQ